MVLAWDNYYCGDSQIVTFTSHHSFLHFSWHCSVESCFFFFFFFCISHLIFSFIVSWILICWTRSIDMIYYFSSNFPRVGQKDSLSTSCCVLWCILIILEYSCLENPMDRRTWQAPVHGVAKSRTWLKQLSTHTQSFFEHFLTNGKLQVHISLGLPQSWSQPFSKEP